MEKSVHKRLAHTGVVNVWGKKVWSKWVAFGQYVPSARLAARPKQESQWQVNTARGWGSVRTHQAHFLAHPFSASPGLRPCPLFLVPGECMNPSNSPWLRMEKGLASWFSRPEACSALRGKWKLSIYSWNNQQVPLEFVLKPSLNHKKHWDWASSITGKVTAGVHWQDAQIAHGITYSVFLPGRLTWMWSWWKKSDTPGLGNMPRDNRSTLKNMWASWKMK